MCKISLSTMVGGTYACVFWVPGYLACIAFAPQKSYSNRPERLRTHTKDSYVQLQKEDTFHDGRVSVGYEVFVCL